MKKIISIALACITAASALASCAPVRERLNSAITLASSDAAEYALWLDERLDTFPTDVIVGIGSNEAYGIDMTEFDEDGYILRSFGNDTLVFGASSEGLDRAVRAYAKAAAAGTAEDLDETYHEGYRVKRLTIAGNDISEYTIVYDHSDTSRTIGLAAEELRTLINKACGVTIPIAENAEGRTINLVTTDDPELKDDGYRYSVTDGNLTIVGAYKRGCMNGVWRFLQHELDWRELIYGDSFLMSSDHVDVAEGTAKSETPAFAHVNFYGRFGKQWVTDRAHSASQYGIVTACCHGMQNNRWCDEDYATRQICYMSDDRYEECLENVTAHLEKKVAGGSVVGDDLLAVDISQGDNAGFCTCKDCRKVFTREGGHSGAVVIFANRLADELQKDYAGIMVQIFAYCGTNAAPKKTAPNEFIHITFCYDMNCSNHNLSGDDCTSKVMIKDKNNKDFAQWFESWAAYTDNIAIWAYTISGNLQQYTVIDNVYYDYRYWAEKGISTIFLESENRDFGLQRIEHQLANEIGWNPQMTEEEFDALYRWLLEKEYGEGWDYIQKYIRHWNESQDRVECWQCWAWDCLYNYNNRFDPAYVAEMFDENLELFDNALVLAASKAEEDRIAQLSCHMIYQGCYSSYFTEYLEGDEERIAVLSERFELLSERLRSIGLDPASFRDATENVLFDVTDGLHDHAWKNWIKRFDFITGQPLPEDAPVIE